MRLRSTGPSQRKSPARKDHYEMPKQGFLERFPGQTCGQEDVVPKIPRCRSFRNRRSRLKQVEQIAEEDPVRGLAFEQQLQTRRGPKGNTRFRTEEFQGFVHGSTRWGKLCLIIGQLSENLAQD
jgi:hypothetical protein